MRYNELKRSAHGITHIMLTKFLQETHGLLRRKQYDTVPPNVEYSLTEHGATIIPPLREFDA